MNTTTISRHHASESANRADARVRGLFDAINEADDTALANVPRLYAAMGLLLDLRTPVTV